MKRLCNALLGSMVLGAFALQFPPVESARAQEKTVYSFCSQPNCADGASPQASLIDVSGTLYGTTGGGGSSGCNGEGCGTVFSLDPATGTETVVYSFCSKGNCADGATPYAGLLDMNGMLYGTTVYGGVNNNGTLFSIDPGNGTETVLYSFCSKGNCADGANPYASLIEMNGTLYGTTHYGGTHRAGTVFSFTPGTGTETVLYSFCILADCKDGANPYAGLVDVHGNLYGTTYEGGKYQGGTVFRINPGTGGYHHVSFCCSEGTNPYANLINVGDTLYGTTSTGGRCDNELYCGALFWFDPRTRRQGDMYSFCALHHCKDGATPMGAVVEVQGILYGTTEHGGDGATGNGEPGGTVFSFDTGTRTEKVLYSFCSQTNCRDGNNPDAGLLKVKGGLYGTTVTGGANGSGTVFWVKTP